MEFKNEEIQVESLPKVEDSDLTAIDKRYLNVIIIQKLLFWILISVALGITILFNQGLHGFSFISMMVAVLIILFIADLRVAYLSFLNKAFAIREHDIIYQNGWLVKSLNVFPFNRIQHCSITSGLFERKFGLSTLKIYTAGGSASDIAIPGLTSDQSSAMRELIIQKNKIE